jgi:outer membrane lipoprotein-sorting protein
MSYVFKALATAAVICTASGASADKISLNGLSNYLNQLKTAEGDFTQINDDGTISSGKIFIKRPGRMRFEYNAPDSAIVLASNGAVVIDDTKSNQPAETYPLKRTPLSIILARNVDLGQAKMVTGHSYDGIVTIVTAQDPENADAGQIQMKFTNDPVQLRQWVINDSSGGSTTVVLGELKVGCSLPNRIFDPKRINESVNR